MKLSSQSCAWVATLVLTAGVSGFGQVTQVPAQNGPDNPAARPSHASAGSAPSRLETAFRRGMGSLKGRVDLTDTNGITTIRAQGAGAWAIKLVKYADVPPAGLELVVRDDGSVRFQPGEGGQDVETWLASRKGGKDDTKGKLRPEVAFRKAVEAVIWLCKSADLSQEKGRITFSRSSERFWFAQFKMYSAFPLSGLSVSVKDDGSVENSSIF